VAASGDLPTLRRDPAQGGHTRVHKPRGPAARTRGGADPTLWQHAVRDVGAQLWAGDRTRQLDGGHVAFLADIATPIAVKLGASATTDDVAELCRRLNPHRVPGRLTFATRLGVAQVETVLPSLIAGADGEPGRWLCDPMHGNTRTGADGHKYRRVDDIVAGLRATAEAHGPAFSGLHLEVTAENRPGVRQRRGPRRAPLESVLPLGSPSDSCTRASLNQPRYSTTWRKGLLVLAPR
jgi:hypothetical protein